MNEHEMDNVITVEEKDIEVIDPDTGTTVERGNYKKAGIIAGAIGLGIVGLILLRKKAKKVLYDSANKYVAKHSAEYPSEEEDDES